MFLLPIDILYLTYFFNFDFPWSNVFHILITCDSVNN